MSGIPSEAHTSFVVEAEFRLHGSPYPFVSASKEQDCTFELAKMIPRGDDQYAEFFNVTDTDPSQIVEATSDDDSVAVRLLTEYESGGLFEFVVSGHCPAFHLAERGALPRTVTGVAGQGRIVAEIPAGHDPSAVIEDFLDVHPTASLVSKREQEEATPLFTSSGLSEVLHTHLTNRQREVLRTAFEAGYYDWPRTATGEEVADQLGITSATFSEHINAAERALLAALFEESQSPVSDDL
jgi:predicted DNA binding protein